MVTEIPKMTRPKMEIATKEPMNPIAQDIKKGKLRDYAGPIFWNYGYLPRTWEDPTVEHPELKALGDNDPVDVVEIGSRALGQGEISKIKVLGSLAMLDDGELDWKVIAVAADDELAGSLEDVSDVEAKLPGVISGIREWFRWYKTPDGKPLNEFGFGESAVGRDKTLAIIEETHQAWERLKSGQTKSKLWVGEPVREPELVPR
jgi:inorganic pyrophosphatase